MLRVTGRFTLRNFTTPSVTPRYIYVHVNFACRVAFRYPICPAEDAVVAS